MNTTEKEAVMSAISLVDEAIVDLEKTQAKRRATRAVRLLDLHMRLRDVLRAILTGA